MLNDRRVARRAFSVASMRALLLRPLLVVLLVLAAGCVSLPEPRPRPVQHAMPYVADTPLARIADRAGPPADSAGLSGFRLLFAGESAFNARIALARRATCSLDLQYYVLSSDETGRGLLRELRDAAARGVRVRLLVDDLHAAGDDGLLVGLAAHPNVQVRLFNPLPVRSGPLGMRLMLSLHQFARINQRMHNKLFIADNTFAVSGGRNVADEYFMNNPEANFVDLDVLASGPVVRELSAVFDSFWNSQRVYPIEELVERVPSQDDRDRFDSAVQQATLRLGERQRDPLGQVSPVWQIDGDRLSLVHAAARVLFDAPEKAAVAPGHQQTPTVAQQTVAMIGAARESVLIMSPYFIPGHDGMRVVRELGATDSNSRVTLLTNSLGATDEPLAYAAYARYRLDLLKAGVRIYELSPTLARDSGRVGDFGSTTGRLHSKTLAIDRRWLVIGSMNLDPRSAQANTEAGLVIDSPQLAQQVDTVFQRGTALGTYRLRLGVDARIEWVETDWQGLQTVHTREPQHSAWLHLKLWLLGLLIPEDLL